MSLHLEGLGQLGDDLAGELAGARWPGVPLDDCEFIPTQARDRVAQGYYSLQPFRDRAQECIAD